MKSEQQKIAIAEFCGWEDTGPDWYPVKPPDYLNDLNAMHEAERVLFDSHDYQYIVDYNYALSDICGNRYEWYATASQRAEAFLKAIRKWKESEE